MKVDGARPSRTRADGDVPDLGGRPRASLADGLRHLGRGVRRQPRWFGLAVAGAAVYGIMTGATAWVIGYVVEHDVTPAISAGEATPNQLLHIGGLLVLVLVVNSVAIIGRRVAGGIAMYNLMAGSRRQVTRQYLRLPLSWHHRHPSGELLSNANSDVEAAWNVFAPLPMALGVIVMLVFGFVQMVLVDPWLALVGLVVFPLLLAANVAFSRRMTPLVTTAQQRRALVSEVAHESFEAGLVVKSLGREDHEAARFAESSESLRDANIRVGRTRGVFDPVIEAIPTIGTLTVLLVGSLRVGGDHITPAQMVQIAYLFSIMAFPVRALGWVLGDLPRALVGWSRVSSVLEAKGGMSYGDKQIERRGAVALQASDVSYAYEILDEDGEPARHQALRDVSFHVPAGSTVAVVGPTGSGKSTLATLVLRLVDPDTGSVRIDGVDLRDVRHGGIAGISALVAQQAFLFDDTVRGNVTLGEPYTDDQVWAALEVAQARPFVERLGSGLDTQVGEQGTSLSGGQRQRIALARAVVRRPALLVLDDATSAVDPSVEQAILGRLREASSGITVLVVAYRLATIMLADTVLYLEQGQVRDSGTHAELMDRCDGYRDLVTAYQREADERALVDAAGPGPASDAHSPGGAV